MDKHINTLWFVLHLWFYCRNIETLTIIFTVIQLLLPCWISSWMLNTIFPILITRGKIVPVTFPTPGSMWINRDVTVRDDMMSKITSRCTLYPFLMWQRYHHDMIRDTNTLCCHVPHARSLISLSLVPWYASIHLFVGRINLGISYFLRNMLCCLRPDYEAIENELQIYICQEANISIYIYQ